jgi:LysR family transcriptional regulator, chromosome initiation inhibitor
MLDYALIAAVAAVVREGSFERAALALHVTPSAVSQRVKLLEERMGQLLVVRGTPCTATPAGQMLCRHADAVAMLEHGLHAQLPGGFQWDNTDTSNPTRKPRPTLAVAVNADSLATWFLPAATAFATAHEALLDLRLEDQEHTTEQLKRGEVLAAVTTLAAAMPGCRSVALGSLRYLATASPGFVERHFAHGVNASSLAQAPCLTFNHKDRMQDTWMQAVCGGPVAAPRHWLPATQAFVDASLAGLGWGMNPAALVQAALQEGRLLELLPAQDLWVPLYWQHPRASSPLLDQLTRAVMQAARAAGLG